MRAVAVKTVFSPSMSQGSSLAALGEKTEDSDPETAPKTAHVVFAIPADTSKRRKTQHDKTRIHANTIRIMPFGGH